MIRLATLLALSLIASVAPSQETTRRPSFTTAEIASLEARGFRPLGDGTYYKPLAEATGADFMTCANGQCATPGISGGMFQSRNPSPIPSLRLPATATPTATPPPSSCPSGECPTGGGISDDQVSSIVAAIVAQLKNDPSLRGPKGERGDPGSDGLDGAPGVPGKDGRDGKDATVDLDKLAEEVAKRLPPIRVSGMVEYDGSATGRPVTVDVRLGETLDLRPIIARTVDQDGNVRSEGEVRLGNALNLNHTVGSSK